LLEVDEEHSDEAHVEEHEDEEHINFQIKGSLQLQVSFAEHSLFSMALLQKEPMIIRRLPIVKALRSIWGGYDW